MNEQQTKRIVVVLCPGRSGSSLLMNALGAMGMRLSENMISENYSNPESFFEDKDIMEVHEELFRHLDSQSYMPMADGWINTQAAKIARRELGDILKRESAAASSLWGFKDPRINALLPLWFEIFNRERIVPKFILAVRDPVSTIVSFIRQYNDSAAMVELTYLIRITDALHHTAADCYIVHYEDWFTRPYEQAEGLLKYTGLGEYFTGNLEEALKDVIKPNLNRAVYEDYQVQNEYVARLYEVLKECRGDEFDRAKLMAVVKECRKAMDGFKGWYLKAQKYTTQQADIREKLEKERASGEEVKANLEKENKRVQKFESDLEEMVLENNHLLKTSKDYFEQAEEYRKHLASLKRENKDLRAKVSAKSNVAKKGGQPPPANDQFKKMQQEIIKLRYRYSFRLGKILTDAVLRPGKNTLLMPYFLAILSWDIVTGRGRRKMEQVLAEKKLA